MRIIEQLRKLNEMDELVPAKKQGAVAIVGDDLNDRLLKKIEIIAGALAQAFAQEGIDLDANAVAADIRRDCGLMGDVIGTDELDMNNPFDAATKQMHDMGPVDTNIACQTLLNVPPHEFVKVFMDGLKRSRGLLPGGMERRALPNRPGMRALPGRMHESKGKDYSYIDSLVKKFSSLKEEVTLDDVNVMDVTVEEKEEPSKEEEINAQEITATVGDVKDIALEATKTALAKEEEKEEVLPEEEVKEITDEVVEQELGVESEEEPEKQPEEESETSEPSEEKPAEIELSDIDVVEEALLTEKITDLKAYYNSNKNKEKFKEIGMSEKDFMKLADIDPTHKEGTNGGGTYIEWLLRLITNGTTNFREMQQAAHEYKDQLSAYEDLKKRNRLPANKRDIMQVKSLPDLVELVATRGEEEAPKEPGAEGEEEPKQAGTMSDFKQDLKDFPALCQKLTWPDKVEGTYEDHLELVGENNKWEIWKIKSPLGAFIMDQWGDGAKWCVGGFGYKGEEGKRSANNYYNNYLHNGEGVYVCFQQKNRNTPRPYNKGLITFDDAARYSVSQFNHSNNSAWYGGGYNADTAAEFARFLQEEELLNVLKGTEFGKCESIKDAETAEALARGEPYTYSGEKVKNQFKGAIKKVVFEEGYDTKVRMRRGNETIEIVGIPDAAFRGCKELEEVLMPIEIQGIGFHAFHECDKAVIKTPAHRISCWPQDVEYIKAHMVYTDEPKAEEKPEEK